MAMRKLRAIAACLFAFFVMLFSTFSTFAAMTSSNYQILWDSVGVGGEDAATSSSYMLRDTVGGISGADGSSASYTLKNGYRSVVFDRTVDFRVLGMSRSYQVGATALVGTTVDVTTSTGYGTGSFIVVIQDEGGGQVSAVGKLVATSATSLTVDAWTTNGTMPTVDGVNDRVYLMTNAPTMELGTLSTSAVATAVVAWEVDADVQQGYSVYLMADHDLESTVSSSVVLTSVADGAVTAGSTEYGARSSDTSLALSTFDTQDTAITTSLQQVASRTDATLNARDFLTLKASVASGATSASYTQELTVLFVGDY